MKNNSKTHLSFIINNRLYSEALEATMKEQYGFSISEKPTSNIHIKNPKTVNQVVIFDASIDHLLPSIQEIKNLEEQPKIIIMLHSPDDFLVDDFISLGIQGFYLCNDGFSCFEKCVNEVCAGRIYYPPEITKKLIQRLTKPTRFKTEGKKITINLTPRQNKVIELLENGYSNKEIARNLGIELATVKNHVHQILDRLNVKNRYEAVAFYRRTLDQQRNYAIDL